MPCPAANFQPLVPRRSSPFHTSPSPLPPHRSQSSAASPPPRNSPRHFISASARVSCSSQSALPLIMFFPLHLDISLVSFRLLLPLALCILSDRHHLFFLCRLLCFLLSSGFLPLYSPPVQRQGCKPRTAHKPLKKKKKKADGRLSISDGDQLAKWLKMWPCFKFQGNFT